MSTEEPASSGRGQPPGELAAAVQAIFATEGPLARADARYRPRQAQLDMACAVAEAVERSEALVVEAGTGVGKTYAYLVPLLLSGRRAVVSTATKGLQDQLFLRDLPALVHTLGLPVQLALLKGRSSYLCLHRMQAVRQADMPLDRHALRQLARVEEWARRTRSGDLSEVPGFDERSSLVPLVTSTRDNCLGSECPSFGDCHVVKARREAMAADLVVVNHHLFFADAALKEGGMAELLPAVEAVVFDEAHQILDTALQFLSTTLGSAQLQDLAQDLTAAGLQHARGQRDWPALAQALVQSARELALACAGDAGSPAEASRGTRRVAWSALQAAGAQAAARPVQVAFETALQQVVQACTQAAEALADVAEAHPDLARLQMRAHEMGERTAAFAQPVQAHRVRWVDLHSHSVRLIDSPLDIRELTRAQQASTQRAWIYTSATLGADPSLAWFTRAAGLDGARTLNVGSPYDYATKARLWVPAGLPEPGRPEHTTAVARAAAWCASVLGGRTFVLATTLRALAPLAREIEQLLRQRGFGIQVLQQGSEPKRALLERFLAAESQGGAVLVGAHSFWEGIDVPGRALQCVVIDKLPFPPPDDPLIEARMAALRSQGRVPFDEIHVAEAAIALKQGAGRLIRSESDEGLLVLADPRLMSRAYGSTLLNALPPMGRLQTSDEVKAWLLSLTGSAAASPELPPGA